MSRDSTVNVSTRLVLEMASAVRLKWGTVARISVPVREMYMYAYVRYVCVRVKLTSELHNLLGLSFPLRRSAAVHLGRCQ